MATETGTSTPAGDRTDAEQAEANVFAVELKRWRDVRGYSRAALAKHMGYDRSYVSKVESGTERPSKEFATHAETALRAGGALRTAFRDYGRHPDAGGPGPRRSDRHREPGGGSR